MPKICDNKSVGMLVFKDDKLLLIERKRFPFGFAPPAGHVDENGDDFEAAARRELSEEVGLEAKDIRLLIEGRKDTACRREGGSWHYWKIYKIDTDGDIKRSEEETKQARFYSNDEIISLSSRTEEYIQGKISQEEWEKCPGIELVWYEWFKELNLIP